MQIPLLTTQVVLRKSTDPHAAGMVCEGVSHALTSEGEHLLLWTPSQRFPLILAGHLLVLIVSADVWVKQICNRESVHGKFFFR